MIKNSFLHQNGRASRPRPSGAGLFVACLCLLAASCNNYLPGEEGKGENGGLVDLHFSASIDTIGGVPKAAAATRDFFPEYGQITDLSFLNNHYDYKVSLFITDSHTGAEVFPGSKHIQSETRALSEMYFTPEKKKVAKGKIGQKVRILAFYPAKFGNNGASLEKGVPFDFSYNGNMDVALDNFDVMNQMDIIYNKKETQLQTIPPDGKMSLHFGHLYTWITMRFFVSNWTDGYNDNFLMHNAGIINVSNSGWIKNKGYMDLSTGYVTKDSKAGSIYSPWGTPYNNKMMFPYGVSPDQTISSIPNVEPAYFDLLVPSFMDESVKDGEIGFSMIVDQYGYEGYRAYFTLKRSELNSIRENGVTKYGFEKGYHNTYDLVFSTSTKTFQLQQWTAVNNDAVLGSSTIDLNSKPWKFDAKDNNVGWFEGFTEDNLKYFLVTDHRYENYLTDIDRGGNGDGRAELFRENQINYMPYRLQGVWTREAPRTPIQFAIRDASNAPIPWKDENSALTAKQLCKDYREGGYKNWRLPRASEWMMFSKIIRSKADYLDFPGANGGSFPIGTYWSGTEQGKFDYTGTTGPPPNPNREVMTITIPSDRSQAAMDFVMSDDPQAAHRMAIQLKRPTERCKVRCVRDI